MDNPSSYSKRDRLIGGYPKIGSVLPSDCFTLAQLPISATVQFEPISLEDAQEEMKVFYDFLKYNKYT